MSADPDQQQRSEFIETGLVKKNHTGRSLRVYSITHGETVFVGFISVRALKRLLRGETTVAIISKSNNAKGNGGVPPDTSLNFSVKLADPEKLGSQVGTP